MKPVSETDHERITRAIAAVEKSTSGEIYCVLAQRSGDYFFASSVMVLFGVLAASAVAVLITGYYGIEPDALTLVAMQASVAAAALLLLKLLPDMRIYLVPKPVLYRRSHNNATNQFLARNIHLTSQRTGVLLFVSLCERYAEVIADAEINRHIDQSQWNAIVEILIDHSRRGDISGGFVKAIEQTGPLLAERFPPRGGDKNELDDHLIEL